MSHFVLHQLVKLYKLTASCSGMRRFINTGPHWALFGPEEALAFNFIGGHGSIREGQAIIDEGECERAHGRSLVCSFPALFVDVFHFVWHAIVVMMSFLVVVPPRLALFSRDDDLSVEQGHRACYLPSLRRTLPNHRHQSPLP